MNPNLETCQGTRPLPYHEHRELWIIEEWYWHQATPYPGLLGKKVEKEEAQELIEQRIQKIKPYVSEDTQVNPSTTPNETI